MRSFHAFTIVLAIACLPAVVAVAAPGVDRTAVLSASDVARLGIRTVPIENAIYTPRVHGYGVVVDLTALAQADANIATAQAAAHQSGADLVRARNLFQQGNAISKQALDAAARQAATDQAQLLLATRQEIAQFGAAPWRGAHPDNSVLAELTAGRAILVRATFPIDAIGSMHLSKISVSHLSAQQSRDEWTTQRIWSAPADPTIPGRSLYALIRGSDLESGEHVLAYAPSGPTVSGFRIPVQALVLSNEKTWCYVQIAPNTFQRLQLDLSRPLSDGYFVSAKPGYGQSVVVKGTGLLLAQELGSGLLRN